jgi:hypothetical protein
MSRYPLRMTQRGHGDLSAANEVEERAWVRAGWEAVPTEAPVYRQFPLMLYGPAGSDLAGLIVRNEAEAKDAALRGYALPSDDELADGEEGFNGQFATVDEEYTANEYPKILYHPAHRAAIPQGFDWSCVPQGHPPRPVPAIPEMYPPRVVNSLEEERTARERGWNIPEMGQKRKLSGAQRRKLARQAAEVAQESL